MNRRLFKRPGAGTPDVRPSPIAGQWYPAAPGRLRDQVQGFLDAAEVEPLDGHIVALVSPHAGHRYSGGVAAHAYRLVEGQRYEVVASVDGLDVVDGRTASLDKRGYVVAPGSTLVIDGFRTSLDEVAAFRFGRVDASYAARTGQPANVGVIGVAIFCEASGVLQTTTGSYQPDPFPGN